MPKIRGSEHPFYCERGNYHSSAQDCDLLYERWDDFADEYVRTPDIAAGVDLNLVWRWDWVVDDESPEEEALVMFMVHQRKAGYKSITVRVNAADEQVVSEYLRHHWNKLKDLWAEFDPDVSGSDEGE